MNADDIELVKLREESKHWRELTRCSSPDEFRRWLGEEDIRVLIGKLDGKISQLSEKLAKLGLING